MYKVLNLKQLCITIYLVVLVWSAISPKDQFTWFLEVLPAIIGEALLLVS